MSEINPTTSDRDALAAALEQFIDRCPELKDGKDAATLSRALLRHRNAEDVIDMDALTEAEIAELRTLVDRVAAENGQDWSGQESGR
jgi:hypothetical protein